MSKEELWNIYVSKNPIFETGPINFTPNGLRKFFDQTFDMAVKSVNKNSNASSNIFQDIFGGFKK